MSERPRASELRERAEALGPYLGERLERSVAVESVRLAGEGMSDVTLMLGVGGGEDIVLRVHTGRLTDGGCEGLLRQYRLLRALEPTPVPSPPALLCELNSAVLGSPFMATARLPGTAVVPWSREGRAFLARIGAGPAGEELFTVLAAIHAIDAETPGVAEALAGETVRSGAPQALRSLREEIGAPGVDPHPVFEDALGWLESHLPAEAEQRLVHGDYRPGNMLFEGERISGVLDWEFAHLGSPVRDLAWVLAETNTTDPELAADMVPVDAAVGRYEAAAGVEVDPAELEFWRVCVLLENAAMWLRTSAAWRSRGLDDLRVARWSYALPRIAQLLLVRLERERVRV
jgi:aminoglycoside phosphotransferase (APT) family kinase protein